MSWTSTLALRCEPNKGVRPVVGLRLTEETLAALRRGDSCTVVFEQGEPFLHIGEATFRLDRRVLAGDREVREVYRKVPGDTSALQLLGTQRQVYAVTGRSMSGSSALPAAAKQPAQPFRTQRAVDTESAIRRAPSVSQLDSRRHRHQPPAAVSMQALTPQQIAARAANTARSPVKLAGGNAGSSAYGVDSPAAQAAALAAVAANQTTSAPKRHGMPLRARLLKLLAMGPIDIGTLQTRMAQRPEALTADLSRLSDRQGSIYYLKPECYQDVQIYEWDYTDEERAMVISLAQQAFDKLGLSEDARERVMLLAPETRPAGWDHKGTLKERVIHALALKPMEFKQAQERAGATEDDSFRETLRQVGRFTNNAWVLQDASYSEIQVDTWPGWTEDERKKVASTMRSVFECTGLSEADPAWSRLANYPSLPSPVSTSATTSSTATPGSDTLVITNDAKAAATTITATTTPATKNKNNSTSGGKKGASTLAKLTAMSKRPGSTTATSTKTSTTASETESTTQETTPVKPKRQRQSKKAAAVAAAAAAADTAATKATEPTEPSIPSPWAAVTPAPTAHLDIDSSLVEKSEGPGKLSLSSEGNESLKRSLPATKSKKADATALLASSSSKPSIKRTRLTTPSTTPTTKVASARPAVPATTPATQPTISNETTSIISTTNSAATPSATTTTTAIATSNATATMAVPTVSGNREPMHKPVKLPEHPPTVTTRSDLRQLYRLFKDAHKEHLRLYRRLTSDVERCEMAERTWKMATDRAVQEEAAQVLEQLMTRASGTASRRRQERYEFLRTWIQEAKQEARRAVEENGWDD